MTKCHIPIKTASEKVRCMEMTWDSQKVCPNHVHNEDINRSWSIALCQWCNIHVSYTLTHIHTLKIVDFLP